MIDLVKSKLLLFTIIFLSPFSIYSQEIISENIDLSDVQKNIKTLDEIYNEKLADISIKKKALYEAQIQVIKSKNSLILLNDLPLPDYEKYQILNDMGLFLSDLSNVVDVEINPTLELIKKIDPEIQLTNNEENEFIEKIFIDVLSLEETIYSNFNNVQIDEYNELDNKIKDLSKILKETDKTNVDIDILIRKIENSENKKTKINSRLLIEDEKIFNLINEEKINSFDTIKFFIDLEDKNLVDPEIEIRKTIQATEDEIDDIKSNLNKSTSIISVNNKNLIKNYEALEKLYKSNRYNEYLIKDDGSLVLFNEEEEKIKKIISNLENEKSEYIKEINFLKTELELKNNKVTEIFKESKEIKAEQKIVDAQINRMIVENNNLKSLLEQTNIIYSNNNQNLIEKYNELESLNNSNRVGKYFINEKGSMLSFKVEEKKIKDEIDLIESNAEILNQQIIDFNEKIKFQEKDINTTSKNRFSKVKELLKQKKLLYNLHRVEGTLKDKLLEANNNLQQARLEGDINKINRALKKKALTTSKLQIARAEIAISKNKEKRKFLSYNRDISLSNTNLNHDDKTIILRKYKVSSKKIDFSNKKINTSLVASVNKNKLKQSEEMLIAELNEADKELKEARLEGDINKINKALKKKALSTSKLQIARAEIAISKNKEKRKFLSYNKDINLSNTNLNDDDKKIILRKYNVSSKRIDFFNKKINTSLVASVNKNKLKQSEEMLIAELNEADKELKEARLEGDINKINKALKKKALSTSKLQIARAEIAISKNKEKSRIIEFDRDLKLTHPLINKEKKKQINDKYNNLINKLEFNNKKLDSDINQLNENVIQKQSVATLEEEFNQANKELKEARLEGDINKINKALKKKAFTTSKLQIARAEIAISKNKEKSKIIEFNRDLKLTHPLINKEKKKQINDKYNNLINKLEFNNKKLDSDINQLNENVIQKQSVATLEEEFNEADKELKEARLEGDINKINKALKKKALSTSKLQIARAEIAISKNKEKSRIIEFDRDLKLSTPLLNLEERKKVHNQYTFSIGQLNLEYNILKNKIRNSINERKLEQNKIDYIAATNQLNELIKEGNETKINKAKERLTLIEKGFNETKNEIKKIKLNQISEINKIKKNNPLDKIKDFSKKDNQENKMKSVTNEKVFLKSGQVFSNDYSAVFNGPSPKEKKALLKRIKKGSSKNINVMSNNLLILNGTDLIVIPLKDILGQTDEKLNSVITAAFDPKKSLSEIRDSISEEVKFKTESENKYNEKDKNNSKSNNEEISNNEFQVSELRSTFKNNFKEVVKAEKEKNEAEKVANKAAKELQHAKKELEEIKSKLNEEAYKKALAVLEDAKKILSEKNDILKALIEKASKEAAEHATAQINVASTKVIKDNAFNDLTLAESSADAREIAKEAAQKKLDDISGKTAFNNALNSGHSLALATQEIEKTIREAATNAGLPIAIINAGIAAQGSAFNQALEEGLSLQDAFNAAMDAGAKITEFENYKLTAKNDLNVKTAALNTALSEVDAKEAILDKAQKDLNLAKEISVNEGKESIQASLAKDNANNEFNSAKENKSKAEQDVIEKKKLCSTCK